jgi:predicted double-glycine peptidase
MNSPESIHIPVKPFQETLHGGYCGPATLKIVLDYYDIDKTEQELSELCNRDVDLGVGDADLKRAAESLGFKVEIKNFSSFDDIRSWLTKEVPVIVNWITRGRYDYPEDEVADGHYSVVSGLDDKFIYLQDPEVGRERKIDREDFLRVWFDFSTDHIEKWEDMVVRQMIAIYR